MNRSQCPGFFGGYFTVLCAVIALTLCAACDEKRQVSIPLFLELSDEITHVSFENRLVETGDFNIIEYLYFYNGGGVAIGDINNDGLPDIYFSANQYPNRLYLNRGNFNFQDITESAGVQGVGNWKTGVTMADVNGDGYLDLYLCAVGNYKSFTGQNQLLINNKDLTFTDQTAKVGLSFKGLSTHSVFFDYDNDGDLDMYLLNHSVHSVRSYGDASLRQQTDSLAGDRLYRNELIPSGTLTFTDVTKKAGLYSSQIGYGLGVAASDINADGYTDLYVSNDFHENDYLYINQGDGIFKEQIASSLAHCSRFSMGNNVADINNDALVDIVTTDMLPKEEYVIKTTAGEDNYEITQFKLKYGYHYQVSRNTLQLNQGFDRDGNVIFSDVAPMAGIEATDWSWSPIVADFDMDGWKDLIVTNGIKRRPNDLDYINFISNDSVQKYSTDEQMINRMPEGKVSNYFFRNQNGLQYEDVTDKWRGKINQFSNGASYADLDNDGDLDLVINNIDEKASILRNTIDSALFLKVVLKGDAANSFGVGAKVFVYAGGKVQMQEQVSSRGWLSSVDHTLHFGLGETSLIDSLIVVWPSRKTQTLKALQANQTIKVMEQDATQSTGQRKKNTGNYVMELVGEVDFTHRENEFSAFDKERLIPRMASTLGPALCIGDINGDKLDDFFIGGAKGQAGQCFVQRNNQFVPVSNPDIVRDSLYEDVNAVFSDVTGDGWQDLIVASGGGEHNPQSERLAPRLYINDGKGNLKRKSDAFNDVSTDASTVIAADADRDGDVDLFIGGRVVAGAYGSIPKSYYLLNDGTGKFLDRSDLLPASGLIGLITDAEWIDINKDARIDLVITGEWMPLTMLTQQPDGSFVNQTENFGLAHTQGWWNTIAIADLDNDGDTDLVAGNAGMNSRLKPQEDSPVRLYVGDLDDNGSLDHITTYFNEGKETPFISREQLIRQLPHLKKRFLRYRDFAEIRIEDIVPADRKGKVEVLTATSFQSAILENTGDGKFRMHMLPREAQCFPIYGIKLTDVNDDGHLDILTGGNLEAVQPDIGRYDAGYGLLLTGDGSMRFKPAPAGESGFVVAGETRSVGAITLSNGEVEYLVARSDKKPLIFRKRYKKQQSRPGL